MGSTMTQISLSGSPKINITRKKGGISSHLYSIIRRFPRKYTYRFLGRETYRRYYTMPLRSSMSRLVSYPTFKGYYGPKCARVAKGLASPKNPRQETAKRVISEIEQRLDSSASRLMRFKSPFTTKIASRIRIHKVKSPRSIFSANQTRQPVSHGHACVNGKIVRHGNANLGICDLIGVVGTFRNTTSTLNVTSSAAQFTKLHHMIYRNMHPVDRGLRVVGGVVRCDNVERDLAHVLRAIRSDSSAYLP